MKKPLLFRIRELVVLVLLLFCKLGSIAQIDTTLKVQYLFDNFSNEQLLVYPNSGNDTANICNGASVDQMGSFNVLNLGDENGYLNFGQGIGKVIATLNDFSMSTYVYIDSSTDISGNGNFIWTFANTDDVNTDGNGEMFFAANSSRYTISLTNWTGESSVTYATSFPKGSWQHLAYTEKDNSGTIYINGKAVATGTVGHSLSELGATAYNFLGRSPYTADVYLLNSLFYDFRIYSRELSATEVAVLDDSINVLNSELLDYNLVQAKEALTLGDLSAVRYDLTLPTTTLANVTVTWTTSSPTVITETGLVNRPLAGEDTAIVILTATLSKQGKSLTKEFIAYVVPMPAEGVEDIDYSDMQIRYVFDSISADGYQVFDQINGDTATLQDASVLSMANFNILNLGSQCGYLDLGANMGKIISQLDTFTISTFVYIDTNTTISDNGNFIWTFSNSDDISSDANGCMFFRASNCRYAISETNYSGESGLSYGNALTKGSWQQVTLTQKGSDATIYINGELATTGSISLKPSNLGVTSYNFIGRSSYLSDAYLQNSMIYDFRVYSRCLSAGEVGALTDSLESLNQALIDYLLEQAKSALTVSESNQVVANLSLVTSSGNNIKITWASSNASVISTSGEVTRPTEGNDTVSVTLTATLSKSGKSLTKEFNLLVLPEFNDSICVARDAESIVIEGNTNCLRSDLDLPETGDEGSAITWVTNNAAYLTAEGEIVKLSVAGAGKEEVILTATIVKGNYTLTKDFSIYIAEEDPYDAYMFVYFTDEDEDIFYGLSYDGFTYTALNGGNPVIAADTISSTGGMRDAHILKGQEDSVFYIVATDMNVNKNSWNANYAMVLMKSKDLINWTSSVVNIPETFTAFANCENVWAPQTIYDNVAGKYLIYWTMKETSSAIYKVYYSYVNSDFTALTTEPAVLFSSPTNNSCIDADIVYYEPDSTYNMFFKTEGGAAGIKKATSKSLTGNYTLYDTYLDRTTDAVEGSCTFRLINSDTYILMYDLYSSGKYQFTMSTDLCNFYESPLMSLDFAPRHATVIPITESEAKSLTAKWATSDNIVIVSSKSDAVKTYNLVIDNEANTVYVPVKNGTNLSAFNPELTSIPGASLTPDEEENFNNGDVSYTVSIDGIGSKTYSVSAAINNNPVLEGYYGDPEILYAEKTGKFYIYPTTDGFSGWSGTYFKAFSSSNLVDWEDEGVILDLQSDVDWSDTYAWAPTIIERKINGQYKYFYYFCGTQQVGVAVSDNPTGPFTDSGSPIVSSTPNGASGQEIDPDVFYDAQTDKYYLFWGNGYLARAELNDDMISINESTISIITPTNFTEGTEVFYRNGTYYFLWSQGDTGNEDYKVRYGTSTSITGDITIPSDNIVIEKEASLGIYATGHNCVINVPNTDKWYIVYHRFNRPNGIDSDAAGYTREVCIDSLKFDSDGNIIEVNPTLIGINPVDLSDTTAITTVYAPSKLEVKLYPNPANEQVTIEFSGNSFSNGTGYIYNMTGQLVTKVTLSKQTSINVSELNKGLYILSYMVDGKYTGSCQFVIQ